MLLFVEVFILIGEQVLLYGFFVNSIHIIQTTILSSEPFLFPG